MYRGPFGIEKLDHPSDRWSVAARAAGADRAVKVINNLEFISEKSARKQLHPATHIY